ncbi:hypothetical protein HSRCO_1623 [Halanaeroarchaeum sp. HSR-CO]|uniref:hypothetical protein n=1 Tax=Halanaeroarchaeum sp. HSR-CO TaxID=2866382 RepID=UPI00217D4078|nr:hypothetical protein [Halanaeroarchaeum sp. HSR-CO]UWG47902.1 hypothetical protein HSRCO_1623 [Halanaeroarchaeum sp. HSR-CO]
MSDAIETNVGSTNKFNGEENTVQELAIISTSELLSQRLRAVQDATAIASGLYGTVEPDDSINPGKPTESDVQEQIANAKELAYILEERVLPLVQALEDVNE